MSRTRPLTKKELNALFYSAVDRETAFETEVQIGFHEVAVARLVAGAGREPRQAEVSRARGEHVPLRERVPRGAGVSDLIYVKA
jgi:hypothetical protein